MRAEPAQNVGVVAIGRNEGERLRACLTSAARDATAVVYVDSGSTDGSVELARSLGALVVSLDLSTPFSAARARNEGCATLCNTAPHIWAVQFIDGDCEILPNWIEAAAEVMAANPDTGIVCGRRRERFPEASVYNRLCDMEWDTPVGVARACGGDALVRLAAFQQVGGYDPAVIAGEEPELCVRLRAAGWVIRRIDHDMTLHDAAMTRFSQWWKRNVRAGHAYAQGYAMHGGPPERFRAKEVRSIRLWGPGPILASIVGCVVLAAIAPRWCWLGLTGLGAYGLLAGRVAARRIGGGESVRDGLLYGTSVAVGKLPQWIGLKKFRSAERRGVRNAIIEYKTRSSSTG